MSLIGTKAEHKVRRENYIQTTVAIGKLSVILVAVTVEGAGNQIQVLYKNNKHPPLNHLSTPWSNYFKQNNYNTQVRACVPAHTHIHTHGFGPED